MTRQHYLLLAEAIRQARINVRFGNTLHEAELMRRGVDAAADSIAQALAKQSGRFNTSLFLSNCGVTDE